MPFSRPSLETLRARVKTDLMNRLPGTDALLRRNNLSVIGDVEAGATHLLYGRLDYSFRQLFPDTADAEYLARWAAIWGVKRIEASYAFGQVQWEANATTSIATGSVVQRADGTQFTVLQGASEAAGLITVSVQAINPGNAANSVAGVQMTLVNTVAGVAPLGYVLEPGIAGGAPRETDDELLARLLFRLQVPPQGGSASDYVAWAMEVPGVTRAWCYGLENGPGTVVVRFMMDDVRAATQGIPTSGDVALVADHIDPLRPVTAVVTVKAPIPTALNITINVLSADTPEIRTKITNELTDMLRREAEPGGWIYVSQITSAIQAVPGVAFFNVASPTAPVQAPAPGNILVLGTITWPVSEDAEGDDAA